MWTEDSGFGSNGILWGPFPFASGHFFQRVIIVKTDTTLACTLAGTENYFQVVFLSMEVM